MKSRFTNMLQHELISMQARLQETNAALEKVRRSLREKENIISSLELKVAEDSVEYLIVHDEYDYDWYLDDRTRFVDRSELVKALTSAYHEAESKVQLYRVVSESCKIKVGDRWDEQGS